MTKQAKIPTRTHTHTKKNQSTKLDSYTEKKMTRPRNHPSPHGFKIRGVETTEIASQEEKK